MADEEDVAAGLDELLRLAMNLRHERAGRVEEFEAAADRLVRHRLGHAVRGEDDGNAVRNRVQFVDEHRAHHAQAVDDELVVDDFVPDVDGRAVLFQRQFDDADRAVDACAKSARGGDDDVERGTDTHGCHLSHRLPG